ncbi:Bidirectional sugar transporter SWEET4 [Platanthera zijinensis]|uniref:Bidirectional sugar transporter SWEET4 n=1 Tax=Platanthera zijinensis TaxID=2320716 RepID=A0AAP0GGP8_9ASPA
MCRPTFYSIWKKKSVEQFSVIPYLITFVNCLLWVLYGMPVVKLGNILVLTINAAGAVIELCYILVYLLYSNGARRTRVVLFLLLELFFIFVVSTVVLTVYHTREKRTLVVGILCIIFCMMVYIAPLSVMVRAS